MLRTIASWSWLGMSCQSMHVTQIIIQTTSNYLELDHLKWRPHGEHHWAGALDETTCWVEPPWDSPSKFQYNKTISTIILQLITAVFAIYMPVPSYYTLIDLSSCCFLKPLDLKIYVHMALRSTVSIHVKKSLGSLSESHVDAINFSLSSWAIGLLTVQLSTRSNFLEVLTV